MGGDFNCVEKNIDRNHVEPHMASRRKLIQMIETNELCDVWRNFNYRVKQYTWTHVCDNLLSMARLDRFYVFKYHCSFFINSSIVPVGFSDHSLVVCTLKLSSVKLSSPYWHFNVSLLSDLKFKEAFKFYWESFREQKGQFSSLQEWWDIGKVNIKQLCQQYTLNVTKILSQSIKKLENEILEIQALIQETGNQDHLESFYLKKSALSDFYKRKAQGALVRSRFQNVEQLDVPSKFFFGLEKKNGQRRHIQNLRSETGVLLSNPVEMRERAVKFYKNLYSCDHRLGQDEGNNFFKDLPKISESANAILSKDITLNELYDALQSMQNGKVPGIDGIPFEFYKAYWGIVGEDLLAVLSDSLVRGLLPLSSRRAILTLLPKKGDLSEIKNWRPVSLLCSDYKIMSKLLANRGYN